jgi:hypothetical protein
MFLENSRYTKVETVEATTRDGRTVTALKLRPLPATSGSAYTVLDNDRLDLLAHASLGDATKFWSIGDANTALQAGDLTAQTGDSLNLPSA